MNTTIHRFRGRAVTVYHSCNRAIRKKIRDEGAERRIETEKGKFINQSFVPYSIKKATAKVSVKPQKRMTKSQ